MQRRDFLRRVAVTGAGALVVPRLSLRAAGGARYLAMHPFLEANPDAVFVMRTAVASKTDAAAKLAAGRAFASRIFNASDGVGIPFSQPLTVKPNLTGTFGMAADPSGMGIRTDVAFTEGVLESIIALGYPASNIWMREGNWASDGYMPEERLVGDSAAMADRLGIHTFDFASGRSVGELRFETLQEGTEVVWRDVPDGVVFRRVGFVAPFNADRTWTLNLAKMKAHGMGLSLAVKNLQGAVVSPLVHYCEGVDATLRYPAIVRDCFHDDLDARITALHERHVREGFVRWDRPGRDWSGGFGMETWAQRTCDSQLVSGDGLHVVEAIYSRNGNGFLKGPGPNDTAEDFLTNMIIFGRDAFLVDLVGYWIGGQEPGNFGLFHIARERGLLDRIDPHTVPLFAWDGDDPQPIELRSIERVPLTNPYLRRDYDGQSEPEYHLVNEPYDYGTSAIDSAARRGVSLRVITSSSDAIDIEYTLRESSSVIIEIFDLRGRIVERVADDGVVAARNVVRVSWNGQGPGVYFCRLTAREAGVTVRFVAS